MPASISARGAQSLGRRRGARFEGAPCFLVHGGDAEVDAALRGGGQRLQHIDIAHDHRAFGNDADRCARGGKRFDRTAREAVVSFDGLVGIGGGAERDLLPGPGRLRQFPPQHGDEVGLHEDDGGEIVTRAKLELRLVAAREAVVAAVRAAAVRIQRPAERHALHLVQGRARGFGACLGNYVFHKPGPEKAKIARKSVIGYTTLHAHARRRFHD